MNWDRREKDLKIKNQNSFDKFISLEPTPNPNIPNYHFLSHNPIFD